MGYWVGCIIYFFLKKGFSIEKWRYQVIAFTSNMLKSSQNHINQYLMKYDLKQIVGIIYNLLFRGQVTYIFCNMKSRCNCMNIS